jgi:hypothetical protein
VLAGQDDRVNGFSSKLAIASRTIATIKSSGTRSPRGDARWPRSVPATRASRSRSPVANAVNPRRSRRRAA